MQNREISPQLQEDIKLLKRWLAGWVVQALLLFSAGFYTYVYRRTLRTSDFIVYSVGALPGPFHMIKYMMSHDHHLVGSSLINIASCFCIHYTFLLAITIYSTVSIMKHGVRSHNIYSYALLLLCLMGETIPYTAPMQADDHSEHLNRMAFGDLVNGYLAYPMLFSSSSFLLVFVLWIRGELRS